MTFLIITTIVLFVASLFLSLKLRSKKDENRFLKNRMAEDKEHFDKRINEQSELIKKYERMNARANELLNNSMPLNLGTRKTGRTTRLVAYYVDELFNNHPKPIIMDKLEPENRDSNKITNFLIDKIRRRLRNEHNVKLNHRIDHDKNHVLSLKRVEGYMAKTVDKFHEESEKAKQKYLEKQNANSKNKS